MKYYQKLLIKGNKTYKGVNPTLMAASCQEVYISLLEGYVNTHKKYQEVLEEARTLTPIAFIEKFAIDAEEKRFDLEKSFRAMSVETSPYGKKSYNPTIPSHFHLVQAMLAKEEWDSLSQNNKILAKIYEGLSSIDFVKENNSKSFDMFNPYRGGSFGIFDPKYDSIIEDYNYYKDYVKNIYVDEKEKQIFEGTMARYYEEEEQTMSSCK